MNGNKVLRPFRESSGRRRARRRDAGGRGGRRALAALEELENLGVFARIPSSLSFIFRVIALIRAATVIDLARGTRRRRSGTRRRWLRLDTAAGENYEAFTSAVSRSDGGGGYAAESVPRPLSHPCPS